MVRPVFGHNVEEKVIGVEKSAKYIADRNRYSSRFIKSRLGKCFGYVECMR